MKIKHWMTRNPITVKLDTPIAEAAKLMREHNIRRLPVMDKDRVAGIVTQRNLLEASPSAATSLSVHELNYLLANLTVGEVMTKDPILVSPEDSVIDVVLMGHEKGIGSFPVVDQGRLVGIATETEIYRAFMALFGSGEADSKLLVLKNVRLRERVGAMSRIASIIEALNVPVLSIFSLPHRQTPGNRLYIRLAAADTAPVVEALEEAGYILES